LYFCKSNVNIFKNNKIQHLSNEEQTLILNAPIYVSALISGVDGEFHPEEIKKAVNIIHIKSFSETKDIRGVYSESNQESEEKIEMLIDALPTSTSERNDVLIQKLSGLNDIFTFIQSRGTIYGDCSKAFQLGS
jgi:hypothetical protein